MHRNEIAPAQPVRTEEVRPEIGDRPDDRLPVTQNSLLRVICYGDLMERLLAEVPDDLCRELAAEADARIAREREGWVRAEQTAAEPNPAEVARERFDAIAPQVRDHVLRSLGTPNPEVVHELEVVVLWLLVGGHGRPLALAPTPEKAIEWQMEEVLNGFEGLANSGMTMDEWLEETVHTGRLLPITVPRTHAGLEWLRDYTLSIGVGCDQDFADHFRLPPPFEASADTVRRELIFGLDLDGVAVVVGRTWTEVVEDALEAEVEPATRRILPVPAGAEGVEDLGLADCTVRVAMRVANLLHATGDGAEIRDDADADEQRGDLETDTDADTVAVDARAVEGVAS